jgi:hypothetical protein
MIVPVYYGIGWIATKILHRERTLEGEICPGYELQTVIEPHRCERLWIEFGVTAS